MKSFFVKSISWWKFSWKLVCFLQEERKMHDYFGRSSHAAKKFIAKKNIFHKIINQVSPLTLAEVWTAFFFVKKKQKFSWKRNFSQCVCMCVYNVQVKTITTRFLCEEKKCTKNFREKKNFIWIQLHEMGFLLRTNLSFQRRTNNKTTKNLHIYKFQCFLTSAIWPWELNLLYYCYYPPLQNLMWTYLMIFYYLPL